MSTVSHETFALERTYPTAPERVFAAWASSEAKAQWFGEDDEFKKTDEHTLDFRVGGREHFAGLTPDGTDVTYDAVYEDIVDGQRIVISYVMHMGGRRISVSLLTVEIAGVAGGARLVLTEQDAFLDGLDNVDLRRAGTEQLLDNLGKHLTGSQT